MLFYIYNIYTQEGTEYYPLNNHCSKKQEQYSAFLIFNTEISEIIWVDNILLVFTLMLSKIKLILIPFNRLSPESEKINVLTALPRDTNMAARKRHKHS